MPYIFINNNNNNKLFKKYNVFIFKVLKLNVITMSNIFNKIMLNNKNIKYSYNKNKNLLNYTKKNHPLSYTRLNLPFNLEWYDSIYGYNKNYLKSLPSYNNYITNIIKGYFNLSSNDKNNIKKSNIRLRRLSSNKIFVNKTKLKHKNIEVIFNLNIFNAQKKYITNKFYKYNYKINKLIFLSKNIVFLKKEYLRYIEKFKNSVINYNLNGSLDNKKILNSIINNCKQINSKIISLEEKKINIYIKINKYFFHRLNLIYYKLYELYFFVKGKYNKDPNYVNLKFFNEIFDRLCKNIFNNLLEKEIKSLYIKDLIKLNTSKFENINILGINYILKKIYKKNIVTTITNLKYFFLSSDIIAQLVSNKIKGRKNKPSKIIKKALSKIKLPYYNKFDKISFLIKSYRLILNNKYNYSNLLYLLNKSNIIEDILNKILSEIFSKNNKINFIEAINNKSVRGIKITASGRLSRRSTASRSVFIEKLTGGFKNIESSFKGLSSDMMRGKFKQNIQYTNINSKTRNGSFGLKIIVNN